MKKVWVLLAALLLVNCSAAVAQMDPVQQGAEVRDYVVLDNGTMIVVRNGVARMMDADVVMSNGTVVRKTGTFTPKSGQTMVFQEGDKMDMRGKMLNDGKTSEPQPLF